MISCMINIDKPSWNTWYLMGDPVVTLVFFRSPFRGSLAPARGRGHRGSLWRQRIGHHRTLGDFTEKSRDFWWCLTIKFWWNLEIQILMKSRNPNFDEFLMFDHVWWPCFTDSDLPKLGLLPAKNGGGPWGTPEILTQPTSVPSNFMGISPCFTMFYHVSPLKMIDMIGDWLLREILWNQNISKARWIHDLAVGWWVAMWPNTGWPAVRVPRRLDFLYSCYPFHMYTDANVCIYIYMYTHDYTYIYILIICVFVYIYVCIMYMYIFFGWFQ